MSSEDLQQPGQAGEEQLWTVREMAAFLRRSTRWVYGNADRLPGVTREFGGVRFYPAAVRSRAAAPGRLVALAKR